MPRTPPTFSDFYYEPLTEDVEELLARFQQTNSVRFQVFSSIWRDMSFSDVFTGILNLGEMKRFCRVALATAMKYFLPPHSYQIRVGGLYLLFAFYNTQLTVTPVMIRLALKDWAHVQTFLKNSVEAGHQDVVYVYHKLVATKAIHYTTMTHFLTFQKQRKPKKETVCEEFLGRSTAVQDLISSETLDELTSIQNQYEKMKEATVEVSCQVTMTQPEFVSRLKDCMSEFLTWQEKAFSKDNKHNKAGCDEKMTTTTTTRAQLVSSIKNKSYSNFQDAAKSRRHRQAKTVESSSSGTEQMQEIMGTRRQRNRPKSLSTRTRQSLGLPHEEPQTQAWLLSAPEETVSVRRTSQALTSSTLDL